MLNFYDQICIIGFVFLNCILCDMSKCFNVVALAVVPMSGRRTH